MPREARWGWTRSRLGLYVPIPGGTGAAESITDIVPGFLEYLESAYAVVAVAGVGSGGNRTLNILKGTATVVATVDITEALTATVGTVIPLTVTDDDVTNKYLDADVLTVDWPTAGAVAFSAGALQLVLGFRTQPQLKH